MKALVLLALVFAASCTTSQHPSPITPPPDSTPTDGHFCTKGCDCACDALQANSCAAGGVIHGATCYQRCTLNRGTDAALPVDCVSAALSADAIRECGVACLP